jgi:YVTN family beta-propeller protein
MKLPSARAVALLGAVLAGGLGAWWSSNLEAQKFFIGGRSTSIALSHNDTTLFVVNRETNSFAIIQVRGATKSPISDTAVKVAEIAVGQEPRCVALHPKEQEAYVTNTVSGTVSIIDVSPPEEAHVVAEIPVGAEPRGCALSPSGRLLFVSNHTEGTVSVIDTTTRTVTNTVNVAGTVGGKPQAIAVTNDGDTDDNDETVYVALFLAVPRGAGEALPSGVTLIEGTDQGKQGLVKRFSIGSLSTPPADITLSPLANVGFNANRSAFCTAIGPTLTPPVVTANDTFCPNLAAQPNTPEAAAVAATPQGAFPNQIGAALIRNNRLYLPNIGAGPAPPVQFTVNVQALVHVVNTATNAEDTALHVNLNQQINQETTPAANANQVLTKLFGNDIVAIDADPAGTKFLIVSRGGNYAILANLDATNKLTINASAATPAVRFQTGNIPNGVAISRDGKRAYVNNEVGISVTAINLETNTVITRDIPTGDPPRPGTFNHAVLLGKLAFFTALGIPDNGIFDLGIRDINPLTFRGKMSSSAWSSCASCHPDGLSDGVTWIFADGPRQTIPLDGTFTKQTSIDTRILNWSAVRGSVTDFNNNSRGVQGGCGFASAQFAPPGTLAVPVDPPAQCTAANAAATPANPNIYNHGITQGGSEALDAQTLWVQTVRPPVQPQPTNTAALAAGRAVFATNCASCHGGAKWTKSQILYRDNPAFSDVNDDGTPANVNARVPLDPGVSSVGEQIQQFQVTFPLVPSTFTLVYLDGVGTFAAANPQEIRANGVAALGSAGFNAPALLGVGYHTPYFHDGSAQTLEDVFARHTLTIGAITAPINTQVPAQDRANLLVFLNAIDGRTDILRSQADDFRDAIAVLNQ